MYRDGERMMAWVATIDQVQNHPNADRLDLCRVGGWQVVTLRDEYKEGDRVIYISIDSWVPTEIAPFLSKGKEPRVYEGVKGERLRTVKLRQEISQGIILPLSVLEKVGCQILELVDGTDLSEILGVLKWEAPVAAQLAGQVSGNFPHFIRKTDQERVQNCFRSVQSLDIEWHLEEKLDGSSCTVYFRGDPANDEYQLGVCSRNFDLKLNEENADNTFIKTITADGYLDKLPQLGKSIAIQGELCGPGIQGNKYKLTEPKFFVFDIFLISDQRYATKTERWEILEKLIGMGVNVNQVPHLGTCRLPETAKEILAMAENKSKINPKAEREGIVFKAVNVVNNKDVPSFKAISNLFLLRCE